MAQILTGKSAIQKGRLQNRMPRKGTVNPWHIDLAAGLPLQIPVAADMIRVGMRVIDGY